MEMEGKEAPPPDGEWGRGLFTPEAAAKEQIQEFSGFKSEELELNSKLWQRRVLQLEDQVCKLLEITTRQDKDLYNARAENRQLMKRVQDLETKLSENREQVLANEQQVVQLRETHNEWKQAQVGMAEVEGKVMSLERKFEESGKGKEDNVDFKKIVEEQLCERNLAEKVVKVMKSNESIVRETVDKKKCVIVFGLEEKKEMNKTVRTRELGTKVGKVIETVQEGDNELKEEIEEFHRVGRYKEGSNRPVRIKFKSQRDAEAARAGAWRLAQCEETKNVWIRKDLNDEERMKLKDLIDEAKTKNEERTEEQKEKYYWRVIDLKIRKWYLKKD